MAKLLRAATRVSKKPHHYQFEVTFESISLSHKFSGTDKELIVSLSRGNKCKSTKPVLWDNDTLNLQQALGSTCTLYRAKNGDFEPKKYTIAVIGMPSNKSFCLFELDLATYASAELNTMTIKLNPIKSEDKKASLKVKLFMKWMPNHTGPGSEAGSSVATGLGLHHPNDEEQDLSGFDDTRVDDTCETASVSSVHRQKSARFGLMSKGPNMELMKELEEQKAEVLRLRQSIQEAEAKQSVVEEQLREQGTKLSSLQNSNESERQAFIAKLHTEQQKYLESEVQRLELEKQLRTAKEERERSQKESDDQRLKLEGEISFLQKALLEAAAVRQPTAVPTFASKNVRDEEANMSQLESRLDVAEKKVEELKAALRKEQLQRTVEKQGFLEKKAELQGQVTRLEEALGGWQVKAAELQDQVDQQKGLLEEGNRRTRNVETEKDKEELSRKAREKEGSYQATIATIKAEKDSLEKLLDEAREAIQGMTLSQKQLNEEKEKADALVQQLEQEVEVSQTKVTELENLHYKEKAGFDRELSSFKEELLCAVAAREKAEKVAKQVQESYDRDLVAEKERTASELRELQQKMESELAAITKLERAVREREDEVSLLKEELENLIQLKEDEGLKAAAEKERLEEDLDKAKEVLRKAVEDLESGKEEEEILTEDLKRLSDELERQSKEKDRATEQLKRLEEELQRAREQLAVTGALQLSQRTKAEEELLQARREIELEKTKVRELQDAVAQYEVLKTDKERTDAAHLESKVDEAQRMKVELEQLYSQLETTKIEAEDFRQKLNASADANLREALGAKETVVALQKQFMEAQSVNEAKLGDSLLRIEELSKAREEAGRRAELMEKKLQETQILLQEARAHEKESQKNLSLWKEESELLHREQEERCRYLQLRNEQLQAQLETLHGELVATKEKSELLRREQEERCQYLQLQNEQLQAQLETLHAELVATKIKVQEAQTEASSLSVSHPELQEELTNAKAHGRYLEEELTAQRAYQEKERDELKVELEELNNALALEKSARATLEACLMAKDDALRELSRAKDSIAKHLEVLQQRMKEVEISSLAQGEELTARDLLQQEDGAMKAVRQVKEEVLGQLTSKVQALEREKSALLVCLAKKEEEITTLADRLHSGQSQLEERTVKPHEIGSRILSYLYQEITTRKDCMDEDLQLHHALQKTIEELQETKRLLNEAEVEREAAVRALQETVTTTEEELNVAAKGKLAAEAHDDIQHDKIQQLNSKLQEMEQQANENQKAIEALNIELTIVRQQLEDARRAKQQQSDRLVHLEVTLKKLEGHGGKDNAVIAVRNLEKEKNLLSTQLVDFMGRYSALEKTHQELKHHTDKLTEERGNLQESLAAKTLEIENLTSQAQDACVLSLHTEKLRNELDQAKQDAQIKDAEMAAIRTDLEALQARIVVESREKEGKLKDLEAQNRHLSDQLRERLAVQELRQVESTVPRASAPQRPEEAPNADTNGKEEAYQMANQQERLGSPETRVDHNLQQAEVEMKEQHKKVALLQLELAELKKKERDRADGQQRNIVKLEVMLKATREELEAERRRADEASVKLQKLELEVGTGEGQAKEIDDATRRLSAMKDMVQKNKQLLEQDRARDRIRELEAKIKEMEIRLETAVKEKATLEMTLQDKIADLQEQMAVGKESWFTVNQQLQEENEELGAELVSCKMKLADALSKLK